MTTNSLKSNDKKTRPNSKDKNFKYSYSLKTIINIIGKIKHNKHFKFIYYKKIFISIWNFFLAHNSDKVPNVIFNKATEKANHLQHVPLFLVFTVLFICLFLWSLVAKIDQFTSIQGRIVPQGNIVNVQHLEGGVVEEIYVQPGQIVQINDLLFKVRLSGQNKSLNEIKSEIAGFTLRRQRLRAEQNGISELILDGVLVNKFPDIANIEQQTFDSRILAIKQQKEILNSQISQQEHSVLEIITRINSFTNERKILYEKLNIQKSLEKDGLVSRIEILDLEARVAEISGRILSTIEISTITERKVTEAKTRLKVIDDQFKFKVIEELLQIENYLETLNQSMARIEQRDKRREVRAPIKGIVKEVHPKSVGAVILPGQTLVDLVPENDKLIIEAYLPTADRGKITPGQSVLIKVTAYDFLRFGSLEGTVKSISADAFVDNKRGSYYKTIVETNHAWLGEKKGDSPISPGMEVIADIKSNQRRIITYLLYPFLRVSNNAFRE